MKDKIFRFIGESVYVILKGAVLILIIFLVSGIMVQQEKDAIWLEAVESFQILYDTKEAELYEQFGIVDKDDADQWKWKQQTLNVAYSAAEKKDISIIASASIVCTNKFLPDNPTEKDIDQEFASNVNQCIKQQINDAIIIAEVYMKEVSEIPKGPTKTILQAIVVECHKGNTIVKQGITDYSDTLQCIKADMSKLKGLLDAEMDKIKTQNGI